MTDCGKCGAELPESAGAWCASCGAPFAPDAGTWDLDTPTPKPLTEGTGDLGEAPRRWARVWRGRLLALSIAVGAVVLAGIGVGGYLLARGDSPGQVQLFAVHPDGKTGFIDKTGKMVIQPQAFMGFGFREGLALVILSNKSGDEGGDRVGFIDTSGAFVIEPRPGSATDFHQGLAHFDNGDDLIFVDKTGAAVIQAKGISWAGEFSEGLAAVEQLVGDVWLFGYIDKTGKMVIPPQFGLARDFSEGLASVSESEGSGGAGYGYIDKTGAWVVAPQFSDAGPFADGLAAVCISEKSDPNLPGTWGFIDKSGAWAFRPRFVSADAFSEGLAMVGETDASGVTKYGYVDKTGAWAIEPTFADAEAFSQGLAAVQAADGSYAWGYIDRTGAWVIRPRFGRADSFAPGGLALVSRGQPVSPDRVPHTSPLRLWSDPETIRSTFADTAYIDKTGKVVWQNQ
jgi:hypothetical protein